MRDWILLDNSDSVGNQQIWKTAHISQPPPRPTAPHPHPEASELSSLGFDAPAQSLPSGYHVMLANCPCGTQKKKALERRLAFIEKDSDLSELRRSRCLGVFFCVCGTPPTPHIVLYVSGGFWRLHASTHVGETGTWN